MGFLSALIAFLTTLTAFTAPAPYFTRCGVYDLTGRLDCGDGFCTLTVFPDSQAQTAFQIQNPSLYFLRLNHATLQARFEISNLKPAPILAKPVSGIPTRALPDASQRSTRLIQEAPCER